MASFQLFSYFQTIMNSNKVEESLHKVTKQSSIGGLVPPSITISNSTSLSPLWTSKESSLNTVKVTNRRLGARFVKN